MRNAAKAVAAVAMVLLLAGPAGADVIYTDSYVAEDTVVRGVSIDGDYLVATALTKEGSFSGWGDLSGYGDITATMTFTWHDDNNHNYSMYSEDIYPDNQDRDTNSLTVNGNTYPPYADIATVSLDGTTVFSGVEVGASDYTTEPSTYTYTLTDLTMLVDGELAYLVEAQKDGSARTDFVLDSIAFSIEAPAAVPVPGAVWLLGSGLVGLAGLRRKTAAK